MSGTGLVLVLRYRKAVTYGLHVLLGALEEHATPTSYDVRFAGTPEATAAEIRSTLGRARRVLVLWSVLLSRRRSAPSTRAGTLRPSARESRRCCG